MPQGPYPESESRAQSIHASAIAHSKTRLTHRQVITAHSESFLLKADVMSVCLGEDPRPCADGEFSIVDDENSTLSVHHGSPSASSGTITPDKNHTMRATGSVLGDGSTGCATPASLTASDASSVCTLRPGEMDGLLSSDHLLQAQKTYWLKAIKGASSVISLPTDHPRPSEPIYTEAEHPFRIDLTLRQMLARLSQEHDLSLTHTVLAGWIIVLSRLSGQENIVIGTNFDETEIHNKGNKEQSSSLLPLRVDLSEESNTVEILERMRRTIVANEIHRRPFNEIVDLLPSSENAFSMTQAAFLWHKEGLRQQSISAQFDLVLHLGQDEDQLLGKICYAKSLFSSDTIKRYSGYLMAVLTSMVTDGNQPVATFDIISPAEKKLMLETWNDSTAQYPADRCIHDQFEDQVQKSPQAIAIVHQDLSLTYRELNCRANALAQRLLETGIKCGEFVAVMLPRSIGLVTAQLAILKVGAAYVPIDIKAPLDRKAFIIKDSAARLVITNSNTHDPSALDIPLFHLDLTTPENADYNGSCIDVASSSLDTAYLMYTSGSTGLPKGAMVPHRAIARLVINSGYADIGPDDRVAFAANPAFDASTFEVWTTLLSGGSLVIIDSDTFANPHHLADALVYHQINTLWLTMALFNQYVYTIGPALAKLKYLLCGGEQGNLETFAALLQHGGPQHLINAYGPTETTTFATTYEASKTVNQLERLPIGRPIGNTRVYILDRYCKPVPRGVVGELYIGGDGVASGYLNRPDLTAERFLSDPFSKNKGGRMYKSGDLVRYLPDGNLVFMGRNDDQVKIRGFRIELGEIEARLVEHALVKESAVLALGESGNKRLVSYVVAEPVRGLAHTLRSYLEDRLPEYMVPVAFVRLDAFPLTSNGKVDRRALPEPQEDAFVRQVYEAPIGETEQAIANIWSMVLGISQISRHDSFFALGGHSLLIVKMLDRLHALGLTVSTRTLFESPTLMVLAQALGKHHALAVPPNLITPQTTRLTPEMLPLINLSQDDIDRLIDQVPGGISNIQDVYSLAPLQDGILFHHLLATEGDPYLLVSHMAFQDRALLDSYLSAFQKVVNRHDILRTAIFWKALSAPAQVVLRRASLLVTEHMLDSANGTIHEQLSQQYNQSNYRMDLTQAPLLRFATTRDVDGRWILVQMMHHLIIDHAAIEIMNTEVEKILQGQESTLSMPPQFRDLVAQVRAGPTQEEHEVFFKEMLSDIEEPTLPFGLLKIHSNGDDVKEAHKIVRQDLNDRLRGQAKRLGVTLAALCHAAWAQVLARSSGQDHVVFGTVLVGGLQGEQGDHPGMGISINTLPFRCDIDGRSVQECVYQIHSRLAAIVENENASLALAQRCSGVPSGSPLFSALLNYRHTLMPTSDADGIEFTAKEERVNHEGIKFLGGQERTNYPFTLSVEDFGLALGLTAQILQPIDPIDVCGYMEQALYSLVLALEGVSDMPVSQLEVIPAEERTILLHSWNATDNPYPDHLCVHQIFEQQVRQSPDAVAVEYGDQSLSYAELNARANHLARRINERGVSSGDFVATYLERSFELVISQLAILKAGATYVPIDIKAPVDRQAYVASDSGARLLIIDEHMDVPVKIRTPVLRLAFNKEQNAREQDMFDVESSSNDTAYVMYTSGSTGLPKGVMVSHCAIARLLINNGYASIGPNDRIIFGANPAFDASTFEVWAPLLHGARMVIVDFDTYTDPYRLADVLNRCMVTVLFLTPVLLNQYIPIIGQSLAKLRYLLSGGEQGSLDSYATLLQLGGPVRIVNAYGPTESTMIATTFEAYGTTIEGLDRLPIGRPISNTQVYVLDKRGLTVPLGAVGELYIGGPGVANGYLNQPDLTSERFLPDPFSKNEAARMYKSGDLVRYLPDGNLVYMGRNDDQIKIRGFRIELREVEARLVEHYLVRDAVVMVFREGSDKSLLAYVAADPCEQLIHALREHLVKYLPEYMIPAAIVRLDVLPMTNNGKVDRRALPAPDSSSVVTQDYMAPEGDMEVALAAIWSDVLMIDRVGRNDNFFLLGGHSLLAVRLMNRISTLGAHLPLSTLFASPTLSTLADAVSNMLGLEDQSFSKISRVAHTGVLELSFAQQRLWFLAQMAGVSETYHIPLTLRLKGSLDKNVLRRTLNTLFARHESLRSVFVTVEGQPQVQLIPADSGLDFQLHDLRSESNKEAGVEGLSKKEATAPFDLEKGPLIRARLIQLADDEYVFLMTQHHIVSDGWSMGILMRELSALYSSFCATGSDPLSPLAIQYPDYAAWQRQWLSEDRLQKQCEYWRETLLDAPVSITLPTDRPRPSQQSFAGANIPIRLDARITQGLKDLSQKYGTTLFMTLLTAWSAVLSRLSGQDDVVIGTPSANRNHHQVEQLIGFFVNTLALRVDLSGEPSVEQLLDRVRQSTLAAQAHQDLPFEQVVEIVQPPRRMDQTPLFQVMFAWQNNDLGKLQLLGLEATVEDLEYNISKFDLELELYEDKDEIVGSLRYSTALFDRETIERHAGYLQTMLRSMTVIDVSQFVTTIELMGPLERELTIQTWNKTDQPYPDNTCIHHLFEDQVKKSPEAIAIVHDDQTLTYRELNSRANGFACLLREAGVKPGDFIPTHLNRSINLVAIQIAILKTGATYVPIDPKSPADRQAYIATDSGARLLVTDEDTIVPSLIQTPLFRLKDCHVVESTEQDMTTDTVDAGCAAYVMYTSGSTGLPKGVMVSHRAIARLVFNNGYANIGPDDRVSFATNPSFDPSTFDVWAPLLNGARIIVIDHDTYTDAHRLAEALARHQVTSLMLTTALFHRYAFAIGPALSKLKYLVCGGEQGLIEAFSEVLRHGGPVHLINAYGPTEATVNATTYEATSSINKLDRLPIGRPQSNTQVYVLDKYRNPVPIGVVGELYIGGPGVANGYLNRSDLTAERFLPDPFHRVPGARMYKSGDLVRYLSDGNLLYMGRNDDQVKIRGYRIELGEIEARLAEHNLIKEAVVLVLGCEGDRRLVAYVVAAPMEQLAHILREHLAASLPDYMVPVAFVRMDEMPLTSNGKVDRRKLPEPDSDSFVTQNYEAPQGKLETVLAAIWAELLKIGRVGRHDNFFMLGGHSLLAVRMIESLRHIGLSLSVRALFDTPVLGVLAASISKHQTGPEVPSNLIMTNTTTITPELLPLIDLTQDDIDGIVDKVPGGVQNIQDIYSLSPLQDGILFHHMMATKGDPYLLLCCLAFRDRDLLERYLNALQQVVDRHDILRTSIFWKGISLPAQVVLRQATLSISEHSLDPADGPIVDQLVQMYDARKHRIDLTNAPLTRYAVAQDADGRWILLQLLHHIIGDHSTLEVMEEEIQAILAGKGNTLLPPQPFRNLVAQARLGTSVEAHEAFFTKMLADIETPALPYGLTDVHREGVNVTESHRTLTQDLHERLRNHARRLGVSLAALCHLAWAQVIAGTSGQHRVVFGTVLFGRMQGGSGSDRTMGLFINTLPLRIDVEGSTVLHKIHQVQNDLATLLEHEHASLAMAQRCSSVPSGTPLFSAILNYRHNAAPSETTSTGNSGIEFLSGVERTNYPFVMSVEDSGSSLGLTAQVIQPYESSRICQYMEQALQSLAETLELAPDTPIQALDILPSEERDLMIRSWNQTEHIFPCDRCVQQLFEDQVKKSPYAIAVVYDSLSITYSGLNNNANNLARQLVESGVKPGDLVATLLKRSFGLVIAQLAILKIGATYVPIDTNAPVVRQAYIASDSCARLLITGECTVVPEEIQTSIFRLKDCQESTVGESDTFEDIPDHFRSSFNAAYVMYTSGSTGLPKGVMVSHSGIARLVINNGYARIGSNDRVVFGANPAFDASTFEVWAPLLNGGTIVIVDSDTYTDPYCLADVLNRNVVTVLFLTPVLLNQYVSMIGSSLAKLRYIISGGEQGSLEAYSKLLQLGGPVRMINAYGPTESTMIATTFEAYGSVEGLDRLPIGRPIGNTQAYVLDKYGMPVPIGAVGELYIGGVGVANGYLNRPELTAERFLPDPFSKVSGARMYKSGDLVRFLQDGNLVFMGRNDDQVKIRGYRIELGEIEARLVEHKYVKEAIVLALGEKSDMRLVAYVVADPEEQLAYTLREYIATGLPDYMVPAAFVRLDELPVTPNGKVDRRALPEPDTKSFVIQDYEAPQGDVETELAAIWVQLLKIERVGRYDNFFTLGGHSLLAVRMIESLRRLGLILSVRALFDTPVLSVLATSLNKHQDVSEAPINLITTGITKITPQLLPLIDISQDDIDHIVDRVPGGIGNIQDIYALSPLQDGILFHHIMATKGDPYLLLGCMAFRDKDLIDRYLSAVQQVVDRHDILRTAIFWENLTAPAQVVLRHAPLCVTELSLDPAEGPIADQLMQLYNPRQHRIELIGAPLTQFVIAQDTDGRWILLQLLHHIAGDHSTLEIMEDEIQTILAGKGDTLPTPQPFRNLIAQARLGMSADEHETFFSKMLSDIEMPSLPYGLTDVHREGINITESHRMLPQELSDRLRGHAKGLGVSLASLCHLAWALVIAGTSGQQRVVFGTVLFGRMQGGSGSDRAMGLFINTLPIRIDVKEGSSVLESVHRVQTDLATLLEHEHASLAMAQRCSNVPSGVPLFSAILNYRHNTEAPLKDAGTTDTGIEAIGGVERTNYPFTMSIEDFGSSLGLTSQAVQPYDPSRICGYMQQALQSLAEMLERAPNMPIQAIGILPVEEKDMMVKAWNNTKRSIPGKGCVHQLFEEQTEKSPEAIAIMFNGRSMTYRTLNNKANRLARTLVDLGVKSGDYVAILLKRSFELVIAQLAILKAGAAYVPIDVKAPVDRQAYIASDSGSRLLITDDDTDVSVKIRIPLLRLIIENEEQDAGAQDEFIGAAGSSKDTAYVMYTSGSTGLPKGVMVPHRGIARLIINNGYADLGHSDRIIFGANPAFDASTFEVWAPLLHGAMMVIVDFDTYTDPYRLADVLDRQRVTILFLTPVLLNQYVSIIGPSLAKLRYLLSGGEQGSLESYASLLQLDGPVRIVNAYGPTESTMVATTFEANGRAIVGLDRLPIGRPIANTQVYVLDKHRYPVPLGAVGELYIGGPGVANGYLNRPDLTSERFVPDPFSKDHEAHMYKSGDLVRYLPDGNLIYMGRDDDQVKIRGFRIEIREIEERLVEHRLVREAIILGLGDGDGSNKRLVAYVEADPCKKLVHILREHLAVSLPEYMIPAAFVRLDTFPVNSNGKVDRRALPAPDSSSFVTQDYEPPQGEQETSLAAIWSELLKIEKIGRHDNFFMLGGHSLLAVKMISSVRSRLGHDLKLQLLFTAPTIAELSQMLLKESSSSIQDDEYPVMIPLKPQGSRLPLFCIHSGLGLSWVYMGLAKYLHPEQPLYGLQARGLDGKGQLAGSVEEMARDYIDHIRQIQPHGPYNLLGWSFGGTVAHSMAVELERQGEKVPLLVIMDSVADYSIIGDSEASELDAAANTEHIARIGGNGKDALDAGSMVWERTKDVHRNHFSLAREYSPGVFMGGVVYFRATVKTDEKTPMPDPASWAPLALGGIEVHDVECTHLEMDKPGSMTVIGQAVAAKLEGK